MVTNPGEYRWSSYGVNALGQSSDLCIPHQEYLALGRTSEERRSNYLALFANHIDKELLSAIRSNTNKGLAFGNDWFMEEIEALIGRRGYIETSVNVPTIIPYTHHQEVSPISWMHKIPYSLVKVAAAVEPFLTAMAKANGINVPLICKKNNNWQKDMPFNWSDELPLSP